jgi:hypothetical protein
MGCASRTSRWTSRACGASPRQTSARARTRYEAPLLRDARRLAGSLAPTDEVILLGSVATGKYVDPLLGAFGACLAFPRPSSDAAT